MNKIKNLILISIIGLFFSCEHTEDIFKSELSELTELVNQSGVSYSESLEKWNKLKIINGNSYVYQTSFYSWIGEASITEITVIKGTVTSRVYEHFKTNESNGRGALIDTYSESIDNLGVHESGALPKTIDELYNTCSSDYLTVDPNTNTIYFETALNGVMTLCGFVPDRCQDDCFVGTNIKNFEWIKN
jgi:hypothetical protein